jgi:HEAT repeat protein
MRSASIGACLLLGLFLAPVGAQPKSDKAEKAEKTEKTEKKPAGLSPGTEVEGRTLNQWADLLDSEDPSYREKAITVIPLYGDAAKPYLRKLIAIARDAKADLGPRVKAITALGVIELGEGDVFSVAAALAYVLEHDPQHIAKLHAATSLTRFGHEVWNETWVALSGGTQERGSWQIRKVSIVALRRIGLDKKTGPEKKAIDYILLSTTNKEAHHVRMEAVQALGFMGRPIDPMTGDRMVKQLKALANDPDKVVAIWSQASLMVLDSVTPAGLNLIANHLTPNVGLLEIRGQALLALGSLGDKAKPCVPQIAGMLQDKDHEIVLAAILALVAIGDKDPKVFAALNELKDKKDTNEQVRAIIAQALEELKAGKKEIPPAVKEFTPKEGAKP